MTQQEMLEMLEAQRNMNKKLMNENRLLWSTVPTSEVFSTIKKVINFPHLLKFFEEQPKFLCEGFYGENRLFEYRAKFYIFSSPGSCKVRKTYI